MLQHRPTCLSYVGKRNQSCVVKVQCEISQLDDYLFHLSHCIRSPWKLWWPPFSSKQLVSGMFDSSISFSIFLVALYTVPFLPFCNMMMFTVQVQNPHSIKYNGTIQGLKYIWRTEGFKGLFKGNGTNCARIVPNSAVKFFSYEQASK